MTNHSFPKKEKLKTKKEIGQVLKNGISVSCKLLTIIYLPTNEEHRSSHKFGVSIPKKYIRKAVYRNRLKRQIREIYRLNKPRVRQADQEIYLDIFLIYRRKEMYSFEEIKSTYLRLVERMTKKINP